MKKKFSIGQEVTIKENYKSARDENSNASWPFGVGTPKFGEIYRVRFYEAHRAGSGRWFIGLNAFAGNVFDQDCFEAIVKVKVLELELETITQFETVESFNK